MKAVFIDTMGFFSLLNKGFTDVTSFVVMDELRMRRAFTHDSHFVEAGFVRLLE